MSVCDSGVGGRGLIFDQYVLVGFVVVLGDRARF